MMEWRKKLAVYIIIFIINLGIGCAFILINSKEISLWPIIYQYLLGISIVFVSLLAVLFHYKMGVLE